MTRKHWYIVGGLAVAGLGAYLVSRSSWWMSRSAHIGGADVGRPNRLVINGSPLVPLNFGFDQDWISDERDFAILNAVSLWLLAHPDVAIEVQGHTDATGDDAYNQRLSERRAQNVRQYLIDTGVPASQLTAVGYGESQPVSTDDATNRRVEFMAV